MKKIYFLISLCLTAGLLSAQVSKTVTATAGNLSTAFTTAERTTVTNLTVSGTIDARDFKFMRDTLNVLSVLDLSAVTVASYSGIAGTYPYSTSSTVYSANEIPLSAFQKSTKLTSIILPNSITSIGNNAFSDCSALTSIIIPNLVISIGGNAFSSCKSLTELTFPKSILRLGDLVLSGCTGILKLSVKNPIPLIASTKIFYNFNQTTCTLEVPTGCITAYQQAVEWKNFTQIVEKNFETSSKTINVTKAGTLGTLLTTAEKSTITNLTITGTIDARDFKFMRDTLTLLSDLDLSAANIVEYTGYAGTSVFNFYKVNEIPERSFFNRDTGKGKTSLKTIILPNSITSIGGEAFLGCISLTSIIIPSSVTSVGHVAFSGTSWYNNQPNGMFYINKFAYSYKGTMPANTTITLNEGTTGIAESIFQDMINLTSITIPNSIISIGKQTFSGCSGLTSINIPSSVTLIGNYAFKSCSGLNSLTIPSSVTSIGEGAFYGCSRLTSINIPSSVTLIEYSTFQNCSGLISLTIPSSITSIRSYAFSGCSSLTSITIPNSVTSIGDDAFYNCSSMGSITIPSSVTAIGNGAFRADVTFYGATPTGIYSPLITVGLNNPNYSSEDGILFDKNKTKLIQFSTRKSGNYSIPNSVTSIGLYAFYGCTVLSSITIPKSVTSIESSAFSNCYNLTSIYANAVIPIILSSTSDVFYNVSNRTNCTLYVPDNSSIAAYQAAAVWKNFTNIEVGSKSVQQTTAGGLSAALTTNEKATLPNLTITGAIDARDFKTMRDEMPKLISIDLSQATIVAYSGTGGTYGGGSTTTYPANAIPQYSFQKKNGMQSILLPPTTTAIGDYAFADCNKLLTITIPNTVKAIGNYAFSTCTGLTSISIPSSVIVIGGNAFYNCYGLKTIYAYNSVPVNLGASTNVFYNVNKSTCSLYVPAGSQIVYWVADQWKDFQNIIEGQFPSAVLIPTNEFIKIYQNLTKDYIKIKGLESNANVSIYNLQGQNLFNRTIAPDETISVSLLPRGLYIVKVNSREGSFETKFLKE
jgi:hypothetical protein